MNRRVQRALDGELSVERLNAAERAELAAHEQALAQVLAALPEPVSAPDMRGAVMWRIAHASPAETRPGGIAPALARALAFLWQPRVVRLRPAAVLAGLAVLLTTAVLYPPTFPADAGAAAAQPQLLVQFRLGAEGAREVALVGDFSGWDHQYPLEQVAPGVWTTTVPLEPGVYDYAFVVNGERWTLDPLAPAVSDGFGGANSRVSVLAPERPTRT
jgi:hypothetical protein